MYVSILVLQKEKKTNFQEVEEISEFSNNLSLWKSDDLIGASEKDLKNLQTRNFIHLSILRSTAWKSLFTLIHKK